MARRVVYRREVGRDLADAFVWYERRYPGLGEQFLGEVETTFDRIEDFPEIFAVRYKQVRMAVVQHFPYAVFYRVDPVQVVVLAVIHTSDNPEKWPQLRGGAR